MPRHSKEAFATPETHYPDRNTFTSQGQKGMTLREWYAGLIINGFLSSRSENDGPVDIKLLAVRSFQVADEMIDQSNL